MISTTVLRGFYHSSRIFYWVIFRISRGICDKVFPKNSSIVLCQIYLAFYMRISTRVSFLDYFRSAFFSGITLTFPGAPPKIFSDVSGFLSGTTQSWFLEFFPQYTSKKYSNMNVLFCRIIAVCFQQFFLMIILWFRPKDEIRKKITRNAGKKGNLVECENRRNPWRNSSQKRKRNFTKNPDKNPHINI